MFLYINFRTKNMLPLSITVTIKYSWLGSFKMFMTKILNFYYSCLFLLPISFLLYRRLSTRPGEYLCKLHVFRVILQRFMPKTFEALSSIQGLTNKYLNLIFMDFFKTLLPKVTVLRVMDAYLLEVISK